MPADLIKRGVSQNTTYHSGLLTFALSVLILVAFIFLILICRRLE